MEDDVLEYPSPVHRRGRNRVLDLLPDPERERLFPFLQRIEAGIGDTLYDPAVPLAFVDFPLAAVVSIVVITGEGDTVEAGTIGNEGMSGVPLFLGSTQSVHRAFYQVPGPTLRMPARVFAGEMAARGALHDAVQRAVHAFHVQVAQTVACNRAHPVEQRLARWLLTSSDRVGSERVQLTHEIMAQMLGVRRASVSVVAALLRKAGFVRYSRGIVEIVDRPGLESASCECYRAVRRETERLLA